MPESKRKPVEKPESNLGLEGFEQFFDGPSDQGDVTNVTRDGERATEVQFEKLLTHLTKLIDFSVDQRIETTKIANQLIDNQRQLIATQQILIRLMEKSIELTRHVTGIEEKLPALFELPRMVEDLRVKMVQIEGVEYQ